MARLEPCREDDKKSAASAAEVFGAQRVRNYWHRQGSAYPPFRDRSFSSPFSSPKNSRTSLKSRYTEANRT